MPAVVAGQTDVIPPQRRNVAKQRVIDGSALPKGGHSPLKVHGVPERYSGDNEIETAGPVALIFV